MKLPDSRILALALAVTLGAAARADDEDPDAPPPAGRSWLGTAAALGLAGAVGGMYYWLRRAEQKGPQKVRAVGEDWYCRACQRDVSGPYCPGCRARNVFLQDAFEPAERRTVTRRAG